ncbi:MAG: EVE domain-containing protein [Candidatus Methanomethylophilaceae archaeon]|jgi:predicted RNA-binding protein|nr:EVE domain-containing protein [Candidatus Methanomethylophilaceae archaeon]
MRTIKPNIYVFFPQSLCMTRWLAISNRTNWEITRKKNIWGVPQRNKNIIGRVKSGDTVLIYVSQQKDGDNLLPSAVTGAFEVASEPYEERTKVFVAPEQMGDEVFPYRIKLKPVKVFDPPVEFKPLIPKLKFITNKTMWTGHIRQAMRVIPEEDYQTILNAAKS